MSKNSQDNIILAGGCFWCIEAVLQNVRGINAIECGYANGNTEQPTYDAVKTGLTGYAEAVKVSYDPQQLSLAELLAIFFVIHNPCELNRQGQDIGTQYRSAIFYTNEQQLDCINAVCQEVNQALAPNSIVTQIAKAENYYPAEDYHQQYFQKNPKNAYCNLVATPKIAKFKQIFADFVK